MNKQKSVILSIALLSALSAGITADAREGLRLSTDPKLTEKAIEAQMKQSVSAKEVNFDNMLFIFFNNVLWGFYFMVSM